MLQLVFVKVSKPHGKPVLVDALDDAFRRGVHVHDGPEVTDPWRTRDPIGAIEGSFKDTQPHDADACVLDQLHHAARYPE